MEAHILLDSLALILQLVAAYLAWRIYLFNKTNKWWLALVTAFFIQGIRRVFSLFEDANIIGSSLLLDRTLAFTISLLIVVGLWAMLRNFENFEVIKTKVNKIENGKKRKK